MKIPSKRNSNSWWFHRVIVLTFVALIWIPLVGIFVDLDPTTAVDENRRLAKFPGVDGAPFSREQIRAFFTDHVGMRDSMLRLHANVKLAFKTSDDRIVLGEEGWYFCDYNQAIDAATGRIKLNKGQLQRWKNVLRQRADYLETKGIKYAFLMVPDKHYIHGDRLPDFLRSPLGPTTLDQFVERIHLPNVHLLDIRPELMGAAHQQDTFYKGDTHWNGYGIKAGYLGVLRGLREMLGPHDWLQPRKLVIDKGTKPWSGGLYRALAIDGQKSEFVTKCKICEVRAKQVDVPKDYSALEREYVLDRRKLRIYENPSCKGPRLVMFHTSFTMGNLRNLLAEHFSRVVFVRHKGNHRLAFHKKIIESERPHVVINEIPSRYLTMNPSLAYSKHDWIDSEPQVAQKVRRSAAKR